MFFSSIALAALLGAGVQAGQDSGKARSIAPPVAQAGGASAKAKPKIYCIEDMVTGSRIPKRTCMPRAHWLERGWDPLQPDK